MKRLWSFKLVRLPVKTFAQTLAGVLAGSGAGLIDADWPGALSVAGMAAVLSFLMNVGGDPQGSPQAVDLSDQLTQEQVDRLWQMLRQYDRNRLAVATPTQDELPFEESPDATP